MDISAILLLVGTLFLITIYVATPILQKESRVTQDAALSLLITERESILKALQELDFDNSLGKIPQEDYAFQRSALVDKGADVLRQLDEQQKKLGKGGSSSADKRSSMKHKQIKSSPTPVGDLTDDDLEDLIAKRRQDQKEKSAGFCSNCGKPFLVKDSYCAHCGQELHP